jgi:hypothetical protein
VGDGDTDHYCWQRPEDMTTSRQAYRIDKDNPGSNLAGETAAALAAASIVFRRSDPHYSHLLLSAGNWAGPDQPGSSPLCFVPNGFGPEKPKQFLGRAVPARSVKTVAQPGPKPRRAFVGPCRSKPGPYI